MLQPSTWHRYAKLAAVLITAGAAVAVAKGTFARDAQSHAAAELSADDLARRAAKEYKQLETTPLTSIGSSADIREILETKGSIDAPAPELARQLDAVTHLAADFIYWRFVAADPAAYRAWRASRGDRWIDEDRLESARYVRSDYETLYGEPFPGTVPAFDRMFEDSLRRYEGHNRPVGIASGERGTRIQIRRINPQTDAWIATFQDPALDAYWFGKHNGAMRGWFQGERDFATVYTASPELTVATVAAVTEYQDGSRRPVMLYLFQDPESGKWNIAKVATYNAPIDEVSILEF